MTDERVYTAEEIARALKACGGWDGCDGCAASEQGLWACYSIFTQAAELIEAQGKRIAELEEQAQWIPVGERLPELHEERLTDSDGAVYTYLVSDKVFAYTESGEYAILRYVDDPGYDQVWEEDGGRQHDVTHWNPLPKGMEEN